METVVKMLHEFPFMGAFFGTILSLLASVAFFLIFGRKLNPLYGNMVKYLGDAEKVLIDSHHRSLNMQKEHYETEVTYLKDTIAKTESSRDEYKAKLHEANNVNNGLTLQIAALEARPDVDKIYQDQKGFFTEMLGTMAAMHQSIVDHDRGIEQRTAKIVQPVKEMCEKVVMSLEKLTTK